MVAISKWKGMESGLMCTEFAFGEDANILETENSDGHMAVCVCLLLLTICLKLGETLENFMLCTL